MTKAELKKVNDIVQTLNNDLNSIPVGNWDAGRDKWNQLRGIAKVLKALGYKLKDNLDGSVEIVEREEIHE